MAELVGTEWVLVSLYGGDLLEGTNVTLDITGEGIWGFATCNWYGGNATVNRGVFKARGGGDHTLSGCERPRGEQEEAYFRALVSPATYEISDGRLEVRDEAGERLLIYAAKEQRDVNPAALVRTEWRLQTVNGYWPAEGSEATLSFPSESEAQSYGGCRSYIGTYFAEGDDIFFAGTGSEDGDCMKPGWPPRQPTNVLGVGG